MVTNNSWNSQDPAQVAKGGTGAATLTDGGFLLGSGTGAVTATSQPTNGQLPIGATGSDPTLATITAGTGISVTNGSGTITIDAADASPLSFPTDSGTGTPAGNALTIEGGSGISTSASGSTVTIAATGGGGGGSFSKISAVTASSSATVEFTGLTSAYEAYFITFANVVPATDSTTFQLLSSTDGGSVYDNTKSLSEADCDNTSNRGSNGNFYIYNQAAAKWTFFHGENAYHGTGDNVKTFTIASARQVDEDVNAIQFKFSSGNIAAGEFTLWGLLV